MATTEDQRTRNREQRRSKYRQTMDEAIALLGGHCAKCGSGDRLEFDHIDPATKLFHISSKAEGGMQAIEGELAKCQLLCLPCHRSKNSVDMAVMVKRNEHGGGKAGIRACDCELCVRRRLDVNNERRRKITAERGDRRKLRPLSHEARGDNLTTGVRGVSLAPGETTYKVQVGYKGKRRYVGRFATLAEAEAAAIAARTEMHESAA